MSLQAGEHLNFRCIVPIFDLLRYSIFSKAAGSKIMSYKHLLQLLLFTRRLHPWWCCNENWRTLFFLHIIIISAAHIICAPPRVYICSTFAYNVHVTGEKSCNNRMQRKNCVLYILCPVIITTAQYNTCKKLLLQYTKYRLSLPTKADYYL